MTQPTKAALEEAKKVVIKIQEAYCGCVICKTYRNPHADEIIATALTAAEERGRKEGEERIEKLRNRMKWVARACHRESAFEWDEIASGIEQALAEDDALAAKEKEV